MYMRICKQNGMERILRMNADTINMEVREREINLMDLLVEVLLHWRTILLSMLIGGILFGGYSYVKTFLDMKNQNLAMEEEQQALEQQKEMTPEEITEQWENGRVLLEEQLEEGQVYNVNSALAYKRFYEEKLDYQQNSPLMQIDPYHVQQTELLFAILPENAEQINNIRMVYENLLSGSAFYTYIQEQCGLERGAEELITLSYPEYKYEATRNIILTDYAEGTFGIINIQVSHENADICQAMADAVVSYIEEQKDTLEDISGAYEIKLLNRIQGEVVDNDIANLQKTNIADLYSLQSTYNSLKDAFSDEELAYFDYMLAGNPAEASDAGAHETENNEEIVMIEKAPSISIKYVLMGVVLFAFLYIFILFLLYIFDSRLHGADSLQEIYGIPQLGMVPALPRKRFLGAIDQWILKLRYHNQRKFAPEESIEMAAVAVKMAAKKQGLKQVYLMGCSITGVSGQVCEKIKAFLEKEQLEVVILNNVLYDAEAMEQLENAEGIVLVETAGSTLYKELEKELQLLTRQKIKILGGIMVEAPNIGHETAETL